MGAGVSRYSVTPKSTAPIPWALLYPGDPKTLELTLWLKMHSIKVSVVVLFLNLFWGHIKVFLDEFFFEFFFYLKPSVCGLDVRRSFYLSLQGPWTPPTLSALLCSGNSRPCSASTSSDTRWAEVHFSNPFTIGCHEWLESHSEY